MTNLPDQPLLRDLARDLVTQVAPEEMPVFRAQSEAYFQNPEQALKPQKAAGGLLGMGAEELVVFVTPVALALLGRVVAFLTAEFKKSISAEGTSLVTDWVKLCFKKFRPADSKSAAQAPPPLSHEQAARIRELILLEARRLNLSKNKSDLLANAVLGLLFVAP